MTADREKQFDDYAAKRLVMALDDFAAIQGRSIQGIRVLKAIQRDALTFGLAQGRIRKALKKYGGHGTESNGYACGRKGVDGCTCGFEAAISAPPTQEEALAMALIEIIGEARNVDWANLAAHMTKGEMKFLSKLEAASILMEW